MKRFFKNLKAMALVAVVGVAAVSCAEAYDDTELKQQVADLAERVTNLEERLDNEVAALRALIDEKVALAEVQEDGAWKFTLADGKTLTLYPEYVENGLTVVTEDGVQYWAKVDGNVTTIITDANGNKVAFHNAPELRVNAEGIIEVSVDGGKSWVATQAPSLFAAIDVKENHACLTLQNGEVLKFALYEQVAFNVNASTVFVGVGETEKVSMTLDGIVEIVPLVVPTGWTVEVDGVTLSVTAPAAVEQGEEDDDIGVMPLSEGAEAGAQAGVIKVLAISKEGKAMVASLNVKASAEGGISFNVQAGSELVIVNNMITENLTPTYSYVLGPAPIHYTMYPTSKYADLDAFLSAYDYEQYPYEVAVCDVAGQTVVNLKEFAKTLGYELERGTSYTVVGFVKTSRYASVYVEDIMSTSFVPQYVEATLVSNSFKDIVVDVTVEGADGFMITAYNSKYAEDAESMFSRMTRGWGAFGKTIEGNNFNGSLFSLSESVMPDANNTFNLYVLPLSSLKTNADYVWEEVQIFTFKTKGYTTGGMLTATFGEYTPNKLNEIAAPIVPAKDTYRTYVGHLPSKAAVDSFTSDEDLFAEITKGEEYTVTLGEDEFVHKITGLEPATTVAVVAFSIDKEGKMGPRVVKEFSSKSMEYSPVKIEITNWNLPISRTMKYDVASYSFNYTTTGGEIDKVYFSLKSNVSEVLVQKEVDSKVMSVFNENLYGLVDMSTMPTNADGNYEPKGYMKGAGGGNTSVGLAYGYEYLLVLIGVDKDGKVTEPCYKHFSTVEVLSIIFKDNEKYTAAAKPTVVAGEHTVTVTAYEAALATYEEYVEMAMAGYVTGEEMTREEAKQFVERAFKADGMTLPSEMTEEQKKQPEELTMPITVTPPAGATKAIFQICNGYNFGEVEPHKWIDNMIGYAVKSTLPTNNQIKPSNSTAYEISSEYAFTATLSGTSSYQVYITWQDAEGNWYETVRTPVWVSIYGEE
ncbi:MAG: hypothetical protein IKB18_05450 [Tidjanibacter sp.]|nr:hypothetical protein [Tidjanibacter sp.]